MSMSDVEMLFKFIGGLGMFLYGMHVMAEGLQKTAGNKMKRLLALALCAVMVAAVFAAMIPVCGAGILWGSFEMVRTPVWAFHGDMDGAIHYTESTRMVDQINDCGGNARVTIYPGVGHDSWVGAYTDPALIEWMLEQHL